MADENVPAPAPTRSDDQILPFAAWVPIGKSNHVLDLQKRQKNPIFQIAVDILQNTNFFRAFTASASVPAIYIQQFWNTLTYYGSESLYQPDEPILSRSTLSQMQDFWHDKARYPVSSDAFRGFIIVLMFLLCKIDEVFRMLIPTKLILNKSGMIHSNNAYLEMVAKNDQKVAAEKEGKKKSA
ncbi:hypothetical protein Tco_0591223 [Tanacetum coccineum]